MEIRNSRHKTTKKLSNISVIFLNDCEEVQRPLILGDRNIFGMNKTYENQSYRLGLTIGVNLLHINRLSDITCLCLGFK